MTSRKLVIGAWAIAVSLALAIVLRAHYTADLSAFLPGAPTAAQELLVDQLREGPASRLILVSIEGGDGAERARASSSLAERLAADANFRSVSNGESLSTAADQAFVFNNRYVLSDRVSPAFFEPGTLRAAIQANLDSLSSSIGLIAKDLLPRDPTGETLQVITQMTRTHQPAMADGVWVSPHGERALLVAETIASGSDTDGQKQAIDHIRKAFADLEASSQGGGQGLSIRLTGPAVFAVDARERIQREAMRLSILSSALIAIFLLAVYRSVPALLLGMLPVAVGGLAGVAAVSLGFGVVHGVTLGFGVTLIGESVDYSIYLFIQGQRCRGAGRDHGEWTAQFWPTIRLGMLTSVVGFATLLPSSFPGLAQLGCYSIAGLIVAALVTRFLMPAVMPTNLTLGEVAPLGRVFLACVGKARPWRAALLIVPLVAGSALWTQRANLWNTELASLSPVSQADRDFDASVRADLSAPDVRTIVIASRATEEAALMAAEAASTKLLPLVEKGVIAGFDTPARYLPSKHVQAMRRQSLPSGDALRKAFHAAVAPLAIREEMFTGFFEDIEASRHAPDIDRRDMQGMRLLSPVDALLSRHGQRWNALIPLEAARGPSGASTIDARAVSKALDFGGASNESFVVLDLKQEADSLYAGYLAESIKLSLAGLAAILILLSVTLRSATRVLRIVVPLVLAVLVVVTAFAIAGHQMTIPNLVGLLLIIAVGSNYALFFDRQIERHDGTQSERMVASLLVANVTTVTGFGVLAFSSVPVLSAVGSTVAPGAFLALVFSALLAEPQSKKVTQA